MSPINCTELDSTRKRKHDEEDKLHLEEVAKLRQEAQALRDKKKVDEEVRDKKLKNKMQALERKETLRSELSRLERQKEEEEANLALIVKSQEDSGASIDALEASADMKELNRKINIIEREKCELEKMRNKAEEKLSKAMKDGQRFAEQRKRKVDESKQKLAQVQDQINATRKDLAIADGEEEKVGDLERFINEQIEELEVELKCPVCFEVARTTPIFKCPDDHLVCSHCKPKLSACPQCRSSLIVGAAKRFRGAERQAEKLEQMITKRRNLKGEGTNAQTSQNKAGKDATMPEKSSKCTVGGSVEQMACGLCSAIIDEADQLNHWLNECGEPPLWT